MKEIAKKRKGFFLTFHQIETILMLPSEQQEKLLLACYAYHKGDEYDLTDSKVAFAFNSFKPEFEAAIKHYQAVCEKRSGAIKERWKKTKEIQTDTNELQNDTNVFKCNSPEHQVQVQVQDNNKIHCASDDAPHESKPDYFIQFWDAFGYKKGKGGAEKAWNAIPHKTDALIEKILDAARKEAAQRPALIQSGRTPKMAQGWLNEKRWEDEYDTPSVDTPAVEWVDPHREHHLIMNEIAEKYGPWGPRYYDGETDEDYNIREEKMIAEAVKRGVPEDYARGDSRD